MKNRRQRIEKIIELIKNNCISSQEELAEMLFKYGYHVTQATLSRDLKMLKTTKVPTDRGTYIYILPDNNMIKDQLLAKGASDITPNFQSGFISLQISGNIAVIKTRNGYASGLAYDIDVSNSKEILGTIPGSDTIIAVLAENTSRERIIDTFSKLLPINKSDYL